MTLPIPTVTRTFGAYQKSMDYRLFCQRKTWGTNASHVEHSEENLPDREDAKRILRTRRRHYYHVDLVSGYADYLYSCNITHSVKKWRAVGGPLDGTRVAETPRATDYRLFRDYYRPEPGSDRWILIHKDFVK